MPKISDCDRCQYFANSPYMVCGVNPCSPRGDACEDFAASAKDLEAKAEARLPIGGGYCAGDWIPQPFPALTTVDQLLLLVLLVQLNFSH